MLFVLEIVKIFPLLSWGNRNMIIITPNGIVEFPLQVGAKAEIQSPDFFTTLTFAVPCCEVSQPLIQFVESPKVKFPLLKVIFSVYRKLEKGDKRIMAIGHRGSGSDIYRALNHLPYIPENSLESYSHAFFQSGAQLVEGDVTITSDNMVIMYHDWKVEDDQPTWNMTLKQIKEKIPSLATLDEVFLELDTRIGVALELKYPSPEEIKLDNLGNPPSKTEFMGLILEVIRKLQNRQVLLHSYDPELLLMVKQQWSDGPLVFDTEGIPGHFSDPRRNELENGIKFCLENDFNSITTDSEVITNNNTLRIVHEVHSKGLILSIYFYRIFLKTQYNYTAEVIKLICGGVDFFGTDDIPLLNRIIGDTKRCYYYNGFITDYV